MSEVELQDAIIRHALQLQRLSASEEARALETIAEMERDMRALLASGELSEQGRRQIASLIREADQIIGSGFSKVAGQVDTRSLVMMVADMTVEAMQEAFPATRNATPERLESLSRDVLIDGAPSSAWWARQSEDTQFRFAREVRQGVLEGATNEQIVSRIFGREDEVGFMDTTRRNVRALVHSSIMTAANQARLEVYKKNNRFASGIRWLATLDSNTCITCAALDGSRWDFDGKPIGGTKLDFQMPPAHFNCRCVASPIPASLDAILGTRGVDAGIQRRSRRASAQGPIADTDFAGFLSRQSPEFVEDVLGKGRADLWRRGEITLTDLVSGSGRPLTLEQISGR